MTFIDDVAQTLKSAAIWLFFNVLGIGAYLASECWILAPMREDKGDPVRDWLGVSLPLFALYFGVNVTWLLMSKKNALLGIGRLSVWLAVCLIWLIVLSRDPVNIRGFIEMLNGTAWP